MQCGIKFIRKLHSISASDPLSADIGPSMSFKLVAPLMRSASALSLFTALGTALAAAPAFAEDATSLTAGAGDIILDAITVVGENRERDIKETASSVAVISGSNITENKTGDTSISSVVQGTPNVVYPDTVSAPVIRGMDSQGPNTGATAFFAGTVPRATINLDGHYLSYNEFYFGATSSWDVETVEVFRGPQTTSQGANAIAGAIIVNSKDPTFTPEAAYQAEIGNYNSNRVSAMISGPIVENELAGRATIDYAGRDTFIKYVNPNFQHGATNLDFSALNTRFKLLWSPSELQNLEAKLTYSFNSTNRPSQEAATPPYYKLQSNTATMPTWGQETNTGILDIKYDFQNGFTFLNQTQFSDSSVRRTAPVRDNGSADIDQQNTSNEARVLFGSAEAVFSGVAGLFYAHTQTDEKLYLRGTSTFDDTKDNLGIFTEATYRLTEQWTLTGGLRFQQDHVQRLGTSVYTPTPVDFDETFSEWLPKVTLAYAITPEWTMGAMVSRGYNPGGVSLNIAAGEWVPFEQESLWDYEMFLRANLLDNRLFVNANVFYMDIKNMQFNIPVVISTGVSQSYTINAQKAHAYGAEVNFSYLILDNVTLNAGASLLNTEIEEIAANTSFDGNKFPKSPSFMLTIGADWDVTDKLNLSGQVRHVGGYYSNVANTPEYEVSSYTIADVRANYSFSDAFQLYGYVKNIFDERTPTYIQQNRSVVGGIEASMTEPRMYGVGVRGTF